MMQYPCFKWCKKCSDGMEMIPLEMYHLNLIVGGSRSVNHARNVSWVAMQLCIMIGDDIHCHCLCQLNTFYTDLQSYLVLKQCCESNPEVFKL